ncbi:hypothetical protein [Pseudomonas sp. Irchel 3F5]|uniref:hypothetical protein n=1 Tax=Pseudomonas sp. Irchel 3F5 TaxID=2009002 RepID=UPI0011407A8D|nr:hypothetical protein [Pseudomonas sp. Irchel 3F5]
MSRSNNYKAPVVPAALSLLPGDGEFHRIHSRDQGADLEVIIDEIWPYYDGDEGDRTLVQLLWNNREVDRKELVWPYEPEDIIPLTLKVPKIFMAFGGLYDIVYRITIHNKADSFPVSVNIDTRPPNDNKRGKPPQPLVPIDSEGLNDAYLEAHGGVTVHLEPWGDIHLHDVVYLYWRSFSRDDEEPDEAARLLIVDINAPIELVLTADHIRLNGNGEWYMTYRLEDRCANIGPHSEPTVITVDLERPPLPLDPPELEPAGLVDLDRARQGVRVRVNEIEGAQPGDTIVAVWDGIPLGQQSVGSSWPLLFEVDWSTLIAAGFVQRSVPVYYTLQRGSTRPRSSPTLQVPHDLRVAGPDPLDPLPVNPLLAAVVVKGHDGDNQIGLEDIGKDVRVELELYADNLHAGDWLYLYWGAQAESAARYQVQVGDSGGSLIAFSVPWSVVDAGGSNPELPVHYSTFNGVNTQRSPTTLVDVQLRIIEGLGPVTFPDAENSWINCGHKPWINGVKVRVPGNPELLDADDKITLFWVADRGQVGTDPIDGTQASFTRTLTAQEASDGYDVVVEPYDALIKDAARLRGAGVVSYRLVKAPANGGGAGKPRRSVQVRLSVVPVGECEYCDNGDPIEGCTPAGSASDTEKIIQII